MNYSLITALFVVGCTAVVAFVLLLKVVFARLYKRPFHFRQRFPLEVFDLRDRRAINLYWFLLLVMAVSFSSFYALVFNVAASNITLLIMLDAMLFSGATLIVFFTNPLRIEVFIGTAIVQLITAAILPMLVAYFSWTSPYDRYTAFLPWASLIASFLMALLLLNPSLKDWSKLKIVETGDKKEVQRPSIFVLAFSQWLAMMGFLLLTISVFIELFV